MEFKFRAVDDRPTPTSYPIPPPLSTIPYVSHQSLQAGFSSSMVPRPEPSTHRMPYPNNAREALLRELEKEQIRQELIAGEIVRRRMLEEEVRRELIVERELGIAMHRNNLAEGFSLEERLALRLSNPRPIVMMQMHPIEERIAFNVCHVPLPQQLPQLMAPKMEPSPETNKDKVIMLAKPDPNLYGAKRKAVTPPAVEPFGLKKKPKEEWSCALCRVSATSERGFNQHLQGRKHKGKEAALRTQKCGKVNNASFVSKKNEKHGTPTEAVVTTTSGSHAKADWQSLQPSISQTVVDKGLLESKVEEQLVQKSQNTEDLKNQNGTAGQEVGRIDSLKRKKNKFWCEICQIGPCSQIVMESHIKGRKHFNRMKKFSQNNGSAPPPSSTASLEATQLIKDTDAVNTETAQKITDVLNEETIINMEELLQIQLNQVSPVAESSGDRANERP